MVFKRKTRTLSLRLSPEEYEALRDASRARGARSVSDYARETLFKVMSPPAADSVHSRLDQLAEDVHSLEMAFRRLKRREPVHERE